LLTDKNRVESLLARTRNSRQASGKIFPRIERRTVTTLLPFLPLSLNGIYRKPVRRASQYQTALRPDEMNSKVHETSALNNRSRHGDNPKTS